MNSKQKSQRLHSPSAREWVSMMLEMGTPAFQEKSEEERREFERLLRRKAGYAFGPAKNCYVEADCRIIVIAARAGEVTPALWDQLWQGSSMDTSKFRDAVDPLWRKVFGYDLPRALRIERALEIGNWLRRKTVDPALPVPPLSHFEKGSDRPAPRQAPQPAPAPHDETIRHLKDVLLITLYVKATPDRQAEMRRIWQESGLTHLLEAVGRELLESEADDVDPEWIDHANQASIDAACRELLAGIDI